MKKLVFLVLIFFNLLPTLAHEVDLYSEESQLQLQSRKVEAELERRFNRLVRRIKRNFPKMEKYSTEEELRAHFYPGFGTTIVLINRYGSRKAVEQKLKNAGVEFKKQLRHIYSDEGIEKFRVIRTGLIEALGAEEYLKLDRSHDAAIVFDLIIDAPK